MSAPAKTSPARIVAAVRALAERHGLSGVTMTAVASAAGVRAPSLYKRYAGRDALLAAAGQSLHADLASALDHALAPGKPRRSLKSLARAFLDFSRRRPSALALIGDPAAALLTARLESALAERTGPKRAALYAQSLALLIRAAAPDPALDEPFARALDSLIDAALGHSKS